MSTWENCRDKIVEMETLLEQESLLLSKGRLETLAEISVEKMKALSAMESAISQLADNNDIEGVTPLIDRVRRKAKDNGIILTTVMNGVKSARERLRTLQFSNAKVGAYNRAGTRLFLSEDQIISEKRI